MTESSEQESNRNDDGTFKDGVSGNPGGRPKNSLKSYVASKLAKMSDEEKDAWLETHDIKGEVQWRMSEGNPANNTDITSGGEPLILPATLIEKNDTSPDTGEGSSE